MTRNRTRKLGHSYKLYKKKFGGNNSGNNGNNGNNQNDRDIYTAILNNNAELAKELINEGININQHDFLNGIDTPLYYACGENNDAGHKIVELLLKAGADPLIFNYDRNDTPLHNACNNNNSKAVELLLNPPVESNRRIYSPYLISRIKDIYGKTPLYIACEKGNVESVKLFLKLFLEQNGDILESESDYEDKSLYVHAKDGTFSPEINRLLINYHERPRNRRNNNRNNYVNDANEANEAIGLIGLENQILREEQAQRDPIVNLGENLNIKRNTIHQLKTTQKCFDPIMYNNVNITNDVAVFYIMGTKDKIAHIGCYDADTLERYKTNNDILYFKCKPNIPITATMIIKNSVESVAYRKLNFAFDVYVNSKQLQKVTVGKTYILRKTDIQLGQIASYAVIMGGTAVSAEHCGTKYKDKIYDIREATIVEHRKIYGKKYATRKTHRGMIRRKTIRGRK
jgi:ankyrin repeat protein